MSGETPFSRTVQDALRGVSGQFKADQASVTFSRRVATQKRPLARQDFGHDMYIGLFESLGDGPHHVRDREETPRRVPARDGAGAQSLVHPRNPPKPRRPS
jgi:hypothetical protein